MHENLNILHKGEKRVLQNIDLCDIIYANKIYM